jgi:lipopolysaccharide transport system ATP-binding protein
MGDEVVIRLENIWKSYGLLPALQEKLNRFRRNENLKKVWALQDISFEVKRGETLGVIGRNGAGKSTLLKVLAGVTPPTRGRMAVSGSIFPMIELSAGLHMELTGRENVFLLCAIMGLKRRQVKNLVPEIEAFCELGEWFDRPVRKYSSGMLARLGFGVALNIKADILLVDEILAVGDLGFQRKCFSYISNRQREGASVIFVSHSLRQVQRLCDTVMLLDKGKMVSLGNPNQVVAQYEYTSSRAELEQRLSTEVAYTSADEQLISLKGLELLDASGQDTRHFHFGQPLRMRFHFVCGQPLGKVIFGVGIVSTDNVFITGFSTDDLAESYFHAGDNYVECWVRHLPLRTGVYGISFSLRGPDTGRILGSDGPTYFEVSALDPTQFNNSYGLIQIDADWKFERL